MSNKIWFELVVQIRCFDMDQSTIKRVSPDEIERTGTYIGFLEIDMMVFHILLPSLPRAPRRDQPADQKKGDKESKR